MTAVPLASAFVRVGVNDSGLAPGLMRVKAAVSTAVAAMVGAFAAFKVGSVFTGLINELDHLNDLSRRLNLPVETIAKLGFVARQSGLDVDAVARALGFAERNLVAAAAGSEEVAEAFSKLGINAKAFLDGGGRIANILPLLAERFMALGDAQRQAVAQDIFGRGGAEILQLMAGGAKELQQALDEASKIGLPRAMDARAADAFNDAMGKVGQSFKSLGYEILSGVTPALTNLVSKFEATTAIREWGRYVGEALGGIIDVISWMIESFDDADVYLSKFSNSVAGAFILAGATIGDWATTAYDRVRWLFGNIGSILTEFPSMVWTVLSNIAENVKNVVGELWNFIASAGADSIEISFKPLTDGFTKAQRELLDSIPKENVAMRQAAEAGLQATETALDAELEARRKRREEKQRQAQRDAAKSAGQSIAEQAASAGGGDATAAGEGQAANAAAGAAEAASKVTLVALDSAWKQVQESLTGPGRMQAEATKANSEATKANTEAIKKHTEAMKSSGGAGLTIVA